MSTASQGSCQNCGKSCTLKCSRCASVYFCGQECQRIVWPSHKAFCKRVSEPTSCSSMDSTCCSTATDSSTCLIVDGMGPSGAGGDYMKGAKREMLDSGVNVTVVDATKGSKIPEQVASLLLSNKPPSALLMLGWGSGEGDIQMDFAVCEKYRDAAVQWCRNGGRFMVQGERVGVFGEWPSWFGKPWKSGTISKTDHTCFAAGSDATVHWCSDWYKDCRGAVTGGYKMVQACMLCDVDPADALFATKEDAKSFSPVPGHGGQSIGAGQTAIAFSRYGEGTVSFFGDVGHTDETLRVMAIVARGH